MIAIMPAFNTYSAQPPVVAVAPVVFANPDYPQGVAVIQALLAHPLDPVDIEIVDLHNYINTLNATDTDRNHTPANRREIIRELSNKVRRVDTLIASFNEYRDYLRDTEQTKTLLKIRIDLAKLQIKLADTSTGCKTWIDSQIKSNWRKPIEAAVIVGTGYALKNQVNALMSSITPYLSPTP